MARIVRIGLKWHFLARLAPYGPIGIGRALQGKQNSYCAVIQ